MFLAGVFLMQAGDTVQFRDYDNQGWRYGELVDEFQHGYAVKVRMLVSSGVSRQSKSSWVIKVVFVRYVKV
jgi:hypothetical protein